MIYLKDYLVPPFLISSINLDIDLHSELTTVKSRLEISRNNNHSQEQNDLTLQGEELSLQEIKLNGKLLASNEYSVQESSLTIFNVPNNFSLDLTTVIKPEDNSALSGLYKSNKMYCTQCEAEGFRRITYYLDRPDVMAKFTVTIHADKKDYPVLLANGNLIAQGQDNNQRHYATWQDPFAKPCYLFAMVAGDLIAVEDHFLTMSGRLVKLKLFVERENLELSSHAMHALKKAMEWDEKAYGREYDLDIYMIVAVNDFNMGAMENKGLNIFNSKYVLSSPATATDSDFQHIDAVVGHEYFHNWSGNRVTCRDWFQLSLKEGFTVFREQQFSEDITHSPVVRIEQVKELMTRQFAEDSGPLAHPVRPEEYMEINNFYTSTIYEKGAEVIRMMHTILGAEKFRAGTDLYFSRHDGEAVTIEDFVAAMQDASAIDLSQFKLWYKQVGTPEVKVLDFYDAKKKTYTLNLSQTQQPALHIPIVCGLLDKNGREIPIKNHLLSLTQNEQSFIFNDIDEHPKLSILRGFSAPIKIDYQTDAEYLAFILAHDTDHFYQWHCGQQLYSQAILNGGECSEIIIDSFRSVLLNPKTHPGLKAELLTMPSIAQLIDMQKLADPDVIYANKQKIINGLYAKLQEDLYQQYRSSQADDADHRSLKNTLLNFILNKDAKENIQVASDQYYSANNMTDSIAAIAALSKVESKELQQILEHFYTKWKHNPLVVNKWLAVQAQADLDSTMQKVKQLMQHPAFDIKNPNKVYALIGGFCSGNTYRFNIASGEGYKFLADAVVKLNAINPQVAARMVQPLCQWKKYSLDRQKLMFEQLLKIKDSGKLSFDVLELVNKSLEGNV